VATATAAAGGWFVEAMPLAIGQGVAQRGEHLPHLLGVHVARGPVMRAGADKVEVGIPVERRVGEGSPLGRVVEVGRCRA